MCHSLNHGSLRYRHLGNGDWAIRHGYVGHTIILQADGRIEALNKAIAWFDSFDWMRQCGHHNTRAIVVDEQDNWLQCLDCGMRKGPKGWRTDL